MNEELKGKVFSLESNIGLCGLQISAKVNSDKLEKLIGEYLGFKTWHDCASKVFGGGKKAKFSRDSAYSEELGEHAKTCCAEILGKVFDEISIKTYAFEKQSEEQKFMKFCKSLGMSEEQAAAGWKTAQEKAEQKPAEEPAIEVLK